MIRSITCNVLHMLQFCRFLYYLAWFDTVEFNRLPCPKNEIYDDAVFANRFHYQLTMFGIGVLIWLSRSFMLMLHMKEILTKSPQHSSEFPIVAWFDTLEFNRLPWSNNKIYDDAVFADRFRHHLTMFGMCILIRLSRLLNTHIAY